MDTKLPRLSAKEHAVLRALVTAGKGKYGLELVAESEGVLGRGTIYVLLGRMEDKGLITGRLEETPEGKTGPPRRVYSITGVGQRLLHAYEAFVAYLNPAGVR